MRRLAWGSLAALGLTMFAACGSGAAADGADRAGGEDPPVADTSLLSATRDAETDPDAGVETRPAEFTILLTSPEGVQSPGLDALVSAVLSRPDLGLLVTAPASDASGAALERSATTLQPVVAKTMTGYPAQAVNGTVADAMDVALAAAPQIDLVVVGATQSGDAARQAALAANDAGVAALVVQVGPDPDLAAASLAVLDLLDYDLDRLVEGVSLHVLDVAVCTGASTATGSGGEDVESLDGCLQAIP